MWTKPYALDAVGGMHPMFDYVHVEIEKLKTQGYVEEQGVLVKYDPSGQRNRYHIVSLKPSQVDSSKGYLSATYSFGFPVPDDSY